MPEATQLIDQPQRRPIKRRRRTCQPEALELLGQSDYWNSLDTSQNAQGSVVRECAAADSLAVAHLEGHGLDHGPEERLSRKRLP